MDTEEKKDFDMIVGAISRLYDKKAFVRYMKMQGLVTCHWCEDICGILSNCDENRPLYTKDSIQCVNCYRSVCDTCMILYRNRGEICDSCYDTKFTCITCCEKPKAIFTAINKTVKTVLVKGIEYKMPIVRINTGYTICSVVDGCTGNGVYICACGVGISIEEGHNIMDRCGICVRKIILTIRKKYIPSCIIAIILKFDLYFASDVSGYSAIAEYENSIASIEFNKMVSYEKNALKIASELTQCKKKIEMYFQYCLDAQYKKNISAVWKEVRTKLQYIIIEYDIVFPRSISISKLMDILLQNDSKAYKKKSQRLHILKIMRDIIPLIDDFIIQLAGYNRGITYHMDVSKRMAEESVADGKRAHIARWRVAYDTIYK